jgi:hypothetical protein
MKTSPRLLTNRQTASGRLGMLASQAQTTVKLASFGVPADASKKFCMLIPWK